MTVIDGRSAFRRARLLGLRHLTEMWERRYMSGEGCGKLHVVFMGEFNRGKSSLINSFLSAEVLPSAMVPTTRVDTFIHLSSARQEVRMYSGGGLESSPAWDDYMAAVRAKTMPANVVDRIEIFVTETGPFGDGCVLVDTPGLNDVSTKREGYIGKYLSMADVMVFVMDASQALSRSEESVLSDIASSGIPLVVAVNKCDRLDDDELAEVREYVGRAVGAIGIDGRSICYVSARGRNDFDAEGLRDAVRSVISGLPDDYVTAIERRADMETNSTLRGLVPFLRLLSSLKRDGLGKLSWALGHGGPIPGQVCSAAIERFGNLGDRLKTRIGDELDSFRDGFLHAMPREIDKASLSDVESLFEPFIDDIFSEKVGAFVNDISRIIDLEIASFLRKDILSGVMRMPSEDIPDMSFGAVHLYSPPQFADASANDILPAARTGCFDGERSFFILDYGILVGNVVRRRKAALKDMAASAISVRHSQSVSAMHGMVNSFTSDIVCLFGEIGPSLLMHLYDAVRGLFQSSDERRAAFYDALNDRLDELE